MWGCLSVGGCLCGGVHVCACLRTMLATPLLQDSSTTMFLIGAYTRYSRPYVWVRSNHERLIRFSSSEQSEKDFPLNLKTTSNWVDEGDNSGGWGWCVHACMGRYVCVG